MKKQLTFAAAVAAFSYPAVTTPANAQAVFESAYSQPAQMIDDLNVGSRFSFGPGSSAAPNLAVQTRVVAHGPMRRAVSR